MTIGLGGTALLACVALPGGTATAQSGEPPTVEVLEAGEAPREPLRLSLEAGDATTSRMTMELDLSQSINGRTQSQQVPPIVLTMSTSVTEAGADGATVDVSFDEAHVEDEGSLSESDIESVDEGLDTLEGITGVLTVNSSGAALGFDVEVPDDADAQTEALIEQLSDQADQLTVPFPEEALGLGARWRVTQNVELSGIDLTQTGTYELREREGDAYTIGVRIRQHADRQTVDTPQGTAELVRSRAKGKGTTVGNLTRVFPESSDVQVTVKQRIEAGGDTIDTTVRTKVRLEDG